MASVKYQTPVVERRSRALIVSPYADPVEPAHAEVLGLATDGELAGTLLEQVTHIDTFRYAWVALHSDTELGDTPSESPGSSG
jgi:hypothetical protein